MKLSDAIALGQHLIRWDNGQTLYGCRGCAMGMALAALGEEYGSAEIFYKRFPWAEEKNLWWEISTRFGEVLRGTMTLDQLIDWVRSVEPAEPEAQAEKLEAMRISDLELSTGER